MKSNRSPDLLKDLSKWMLDRTLLTKGCTILSPMSQPHCPITGYVVALKGFTVAFEVAEDSDLWHKCIVGLLYLLRELGCDTRKGCGIGTWSCHAGPLFHIHFDVVYCTDTAKSAAAIAHAFFQGAIYDIEKGEVIYVLDDGSQAPPVDE